jgi:DNA polymerase-3 subunit beta
MKITSNKENLITVLQTVQSAINPRASLPILSNILIRAENGNLHLTGTDLDIGISSYTTASIGTPGAITVPAKRFTDIVKELPEGEITITAKRNNIVTIECENISFKIMGMPKEEFPKLPEFSQQQSINLSQQTLKQMLAMTSFAMSRDETRYILNGTLFRIKDEHLTIVATDGRRLSLIKKGVKIPEQITAKFIVPTKTVNELMRDLADTTDSVRISYTTNQILFDIGHTTIVSRLIEGEYPNYEQVIPKETKEKLTIDKEKLFFATRRASLLTTQDSLGVKLDVTKDKVIVSKSTPDIGESREELAAHYNGTQICIGFNPSYLLDVLKNIDIDTVALELLGPDKPGVIRLGDEYTYVVLPMQLT